LRQRSGDALAIADDNHYYLISSSENPHFLFRGDVVMEREVIEGLKIALLATGFTALAVTVLAVGL
jgi:hypothetical protein